MLNEKQKKIVDWLENNLNLPVYSHAYMGAVILLNAKSAGYLSYVSHAGRDFFNGLARDVKNIKSKQVQYAQKIDGIKNIWDSQWGGKGIALNDSGASDSAYSGHIIPYNVCQKISDLIAENDSVRKRNDENIALFFYTFMDYHDLELIPKNMIFEWTQAKNWFTANTHLRRKPMSDKADDEIQMHFACLENMLYVAASTSFQRTKELNEILDQTNA